MEKGELLENATSLPPFSYAAFTHAFLATTNRTRSLLKVFLCGQGHAIYNMVVYEENRKPA